MQFSQKEKNFSELFAAFLESIWNFERFEKEMTFIAFVFPKLRTLKTWLDKCLKNAVPDDPLTSNMVNVPKHCLNLYQITWSYSLVTAKSMELEKLSLIDMQNLGTAC